MFCADHDVIIKSCMGAGHAARSRTPAGVHRLRWPRFRGCYPRLFSSSPPGCPNHDVHPGGVTQDYFPAIPYITGSYARLLRKSLQVPRLCAPLEQIHPGLTARPKARSPSQKCINSGPGVLRPPVFLQPTIIFFDHAGKLTEAKWADGTMHKVGNRYDTPYTSSLVTYLRSRTARSIESKQCSFQCLTECHPVGLRNKKTEGKRGRIVSPPTPRTERYFCFSLRARRLGGVFLFTPFE